MRPSDAAIMPPQRRGTLARMSFARRSAVLAGLALLAIPARAATPPDPRFLTGPAWRVEQIGARAVLEHVQPSLAFTHSGRVQGQGGCNGFSGPYLADGASLSIGPLAATRMGCRGAIGDQEGRFLAALAEVRGWRAELGLLHLTNAAGATLIRLAR